MAQEVAGKVGQKEAAIASSTPAKSFLPSALSRVSPWASSTDPSPGVRAASTSQIDVQRPDQMAEAESVPPQNKDAAPSKQQRVNASRYPKGCPPLSVQWFYASDFPKRKPNLSGQPITDPKPMKPSVKYAAFSLQDSKAIETAFQEVCDRDEAITEKDSVSVVGDGDLSVGKGPKPNSSAKDGSAKRTHEGQIKPTPEEESVLVPVNEDYLFDVDIRKRELLPTYWLGPVFEVRRGSWFYPGE